MIVISHLNDQEIYDFWKVSWDLANNLLLKLVDKSCGSKYLLCDSSNSDTWFFQPTKKIEGDSESCCPSCLVDYPLYGAMEISLKGAYIACVVAVCRI